MIGFGTGAALQQSAKRTEAPLRVTFVPISSRPTGSNS